MGKKGEALRAAKRQQTMYHFTREQLAAHDQFVREEFRERCTKDVEEKVWQKMEPIFDEKKKELEKAILDDWDERKRLFASEVPENNFLEFICCMMSVSIRVLIEKFHWKPVPKDGFYDRRLAIVRFSDYVKAEIDMISADEMQDIRKYNEETFNLYGVKFAAEFEE